MGAAVVVVVVVDAPLPNGRLPTGRLANKFDLRIDGAASSCDHADDKSINKANKKNKLKSMKKKPKLLNKMGHEMLHHF